MIRKFQAFFVIAYIASVVGYIVWHRAPQPNPIPLQPTPTPLSPHDREAATAKRVRDYLDIVTLGDKTPEWLRGVKDVSFKGHTLSLTTSTAEGVDVLCATTLEFANKAVAAEIYDLKIIDGNSKVIARGRRGEPACSVEGSVQ